jgi:hypothetical protein
MNQIKFKMNWRAKDIYELKEKKKREAETLERERGEGSRIIRDKRKMMIKK